jgi:hypothetical protein
MAANEREFEVLGKGAEYLNQRFAENQRRSCQTCAPAL